MPEAQPGQEQRMDDLVSRLQARRKHLGLGGVVPGHEYINPDGPEAADRLILYREAVGPLLDMVDELYRKYGVELDAHDVGIAQGARAVLSRSGDQTKMGPPSRASGGVEAARGGPL